MIIGVSPRKHVLDGLRDDEQAFLSLPLTWNGVGQGYSEDIDSDAGLMGRVCRWLPQGRLRQERAG